MAAHTGNENLAKRYATAFFALAQEQDKLADVEKDMTTLSAFLSSDASLTQFMHDVTLTRRQQATALLAVAKHLGVSALTEKLLGVMADRRRLPVLGAVVAAVRGLIAEQRGEMTAYVTAAQALDQKQIADIEQKLKQQTGKDVRVALDINPDIMGGLIIRIGSKLIDSSVRTKLDRLHRNLRQSNELSSQKKMKEVA